MNGSRLQTAKQAVRPSLKARLMLSGPAGAGKTYSALEMATVLGERILVIDTEKESALTYADEFKFTHLAWREPFDPRELGATLVEAAANYDVIIVDSMSHFWGGQGGTLDIADGKFGGWKTARPAQNDAVQGILAASCHVLICVRSAIEHVQEKDERTGKQVVKKLGLAPKQDKDLEYELNLAVEISIEHKISVSKSRTTAVPVGREFAPGHARDLAKEYAAWLQSGEPFADTGVVEAIKVALAALGDEDKREVWSEWKSRGLPADASLLTISQAELVKTIVDAVVSEARSAPAAEVAAVQPESVVEARPGPPPVAEVKTEPEAAAGVSVSERRRALQKIVRGSTNPEAMQGFITLGLKARRLVGVDSMSPIEYDVFQAEVIREVVILRQREEATEVDLEREALAKGWIVIGYNDKKPLYGPPHGGGTQPQQPVSARIAPKPIDPS